MVQAVALHGGWLDVQRPKQRQPELEGPLGGRKSIVEVKDIPQARCKRQGWACVAQRSAFEAPGGGGHGEDGRHPVLKLCQPGVAALLNELAGEALGVPSRQTQGDGP